MGKKFRIELVSFTNVNTFTKFVNLTISDLCDSGREIIKVDYSTCCNIKNEIVYSAFIEHRGKDEDSKKVIKNN